MATIILPFENGTTPNDTVADQPWFTVAFENIHENNGDDVEIPNSRVGMSDMRFSMTGNKTEIADTWIFKAELPNGADVTVTVSFFFFFF